MRTEEKINKDLQVNQSDELFFWLENKLGEKDISYVNNECEHLSFMLHWINEKSTNLYEEKKKYRDSIDDPSDNVDNDDADQFIKCKIIAIIVSIIEPSAAHSC